MLNETYDLKLTYETIDKNQTNCVIMNLRHLPVLHCRHNNAFMI